MIIHPGELSKKWIDRLADAGIDTLGIHPEGGAGAPKTLARLLELLKTPEYRALIDYAKSRGLKIEYECHAAGYLMDKSLFADHPEYFRMNSEVKKWISEAEEITVYVTSERFFRKKGRSRRSGRSARRTSTAIA